MKRHEHAQLLFTKGCQDEALVEEVLVSAHISDEVIGFHCQQAAEKFLAADIAAFRAGTRP
jgi:hypothetical protein